MKIWIYCCNVIYNLLCHKNKATIVVEQVFGTAHLKFSTLHYKPEMQRNASTLIWETIETEL